MDPQEEFLEYVKQNPQYYSIMRAPVYMRILQSLKQKASDISELRTEANVEEGDLILILDSLEQIKLVERIELRNRILYALSREGDTFLEKYQKGYLVFGSALP